MITTTKQVYIIGAGASGLMAACRAAELGARVTVYEAQSVEGKKLSTTGNGKCNYTNMHMSPEAYHIAVSKNNSSEASRAQDAGTPNKTQFYECFDKFGNTDTIDFFRSIGIEPLVKNGYVYPRSEQAASVVRALVRRCEALGVKIIKDHRVESLRQLGICSSKAEAKHEKSVILACGSKAANKSCNSYRLLEELGVSYSWVDPALCPVHCKGDDDFFKAVAGVRCPARIGNETGELQFTDYGLSGIVIFNVSHEISEGLRQQPAQAGTKNVCIDLLPELADEDAAAALFKERLNNMRRIDSKAPLSSNIRDGKDISSAISEISTSCDHRHTAEGYTRTDTIDYGIRNIEELRLLGDGLINSKLWNALIDRMLRGLQKSAGQITIRELAHELKSCGFTAYKTAGFDKCQVCSGGIGLDEIDPETMQLRKHPGIYAAGEIIDMDGICGGYNLQWAWTSGYIAGTYAAGGTL